MCHGKIRGEIMIHGLVLQNYVIEWGLALVRGSDLFDILSAKCAKGGEI